MKTLLGRFKNWKTTLLGALAAALIAAGGSLSEGQVDYKIILAAAGAAAIGSVLKDPAKKVKPVKGIAKAIVVDEETGEDVG
jgi:hypothetical protein